MTDNLTILKNEYETLKGQFIINNDKIERLVGFGDDGEDYYFLTFNGRHITWNSCVIRIIPLRGFIKKDDYNNFKRLAKLNHFDQIDKKGFMKFFNSYINDLPEDHIFISKFCWDLN